MADRVLTDKQKAFLSALANEAAGDLRTAMTMAGYSNQTSVNEVLNSLTDEIIDTAKRLLAANSMKAAFKMVGVLDRPSDLGSDKIIAASKEILDRAGVIKKEEQINAVRVDAIVILPPKQAIAIQESGE